MATLTALLREPVGLWYYGGATAYAVLGYGFGLAGLFATGWDRMLAASREGQQGDTES